MGNTDSKIKVIYISLDSLLDSRLGTLIKINPEFAFNVTSKKEYYLREEDLFEDEEFGKLSKEIFTTINQKHKEEIIRTSLLTKMYAFLNELFSTLLVNITTTPYLSGVELVINLYPYDFSEKEIVNIIKAVAHLLKNNITVKAINISHKDLTCDYVKNNYTAMIMYDYGDWLNIHHRKLQTNLIKDVILYVPRLNYVRAITDEEKKLFEDRGVDSFEFIRMALCEFINIQHLPIGLFSADTPKNI